MNTLTDLPKGRRWSQFSLRTLFVMITLSAIACPIANHCYQEYQKRKIAEAERRQIFTFYIGFAR